MGTTRIPGKLLKANSVTGNEIKDQTISQDDLSLTLSSVGTAESLDTTGAAVDVSAATPPTSGQVLTALTPTTANWQTPTGGSSQWLDDSPNIFFNAGYVGVGTSLSAPSFIGIPASLRVYAATENYAAAFTDNVNSSLTINATANPVAGMRIHADYNMIFSVVNSTSSDMVITGAGNVGIGTSTPARKLHVHDASASVVQLSAGPSDDAGPKMLIVMPAVGDAYLGPADNVAGLGLMTRGIIRMTMLGLGPGEGNVGIGTVAPDTKLHVAGSVKIVDGSEGANKVLLSDASGLAAWAGIVTDGFDVLVDEDSGEVIFA